MKRVILYTSLELRAWKSSQAVSASQKKGAPVLSTRKRLLELGCRARSCRREDKERAVVLDMHIGIANANGHMSARSDIFNSYFPCMSSLFSTDMDVMLLIY